MGLFSGFGSNNRKVTSYEYEKKGTGAKSHIFSRFSGSFGLKKKKMAEFDAVVHSAMDHGGRTKFDDGIDANELTEIVAKLKQHDKDFDLNEADIKAAEEELRKRL